MQIRPWAPSTSCARVRAGIAESAFGYYVHDGYRLTVKLRRGPTRPDPMIVRHYRCLSASGLYAETEVQLSAKRLLQATRGKKGRARSAGAVIAQALDRSAAHNVPQRECRLCSRKSNGQCHRARRFEHSAPRGEPHASPKTRRPTKSSDATGPCGGRRRYARELRDSFMPKAKGTAARLFGVPPPTQSCLPRLVLSPHSLARGRRQVEPIAARSPQLHPKALYRATSS
jgi:hypothetical protein